MIDQDFKRKEDFENLSKVPVLLVRFEDFVKKFEDFEEYIRVEIKEIFNKIDKLDSLRERIAENEVSLQNINDRINFLENQIIKIINENSSFLKKISFELLLLIFSIVFSLIYILFKNK